MCGEVFTLHREKSTQIPIGFCTHFISLVLCMGDWKRSQCTEANINTDSQWFLYPFYLSWSLHGPLTKSLSGRISSKSLGPCSDHDLGLNCFAPIILDFFKPFFGSLQFCAYRVKYVVAGAKYGLFTLPTHVKCIAFQVNNNCSTGSTALNMAKQLIEGGNLIKVFNVLQVAIG